MVNTFIYTENNENYIYIHNITLCKQLNLLIFTKNIIYEDNLYFHLHKLQWNSIMLSDSTEYIWHWILPIKIHRHLLNDLQRLINECDHRKGVIYEFLQRWELSSDVKQICHTSKSSVLPVVQALVYHWKKIVSSMCRYVIMHKDTIYQPLRSGRIWHKVNF